MRRRSRRRPTPSPAPRRRSGAPGSSAAPPAASRPRPTPAAPRAARTTPLLIVAVAVLVVVVAGWLLEPSPQSGADRRGVACLRPRDRRGAPSRAARRRLGLTGDRHERSLYLVRKLVQALVTIARDRRPELRPVPDDAGLAGAGSAEPAPHAPSSSPPSARALGPRQAARSPTSSSPTSRSTATGRPRLLDQVPRPARHRVVIGRDSGRRSS